MTDCVLQNDEWVVCRVFQKIAGNKKLFMYADMPYAMTDSHSTLPGHGGRDSSPNPTVTDDCDCDTGTGNESCYNCQDNFREASTLVHDVPWVQVADSKLGNNNNNTTTNTVAMATSAMDVSNLMKDSYYNSNNVVAMNMGQRYQTPLTPVKVFDGRRGVRGVTKVEPFYSESGEDEAQSSQRLNLDYAWPGCSDNVLSYQEFPCESPLMQTVTGESHGGGIAASMTTSCITDGAFGDDQHARLLHRLRGFSSLPEMSGPIDGLQELGWAY